MKQTKVPLHIARPVGLVQHGLLVGLTLAAILVADPAMAARRGTGDVPQDLRQAAAAAAAANAAPQAAVKKQPGNKPILRHGRHAYKPHAGAR